MLDYSLGASKRQSLLIYLIYTLKMSLRIAIFTCLLALVLSCLATLIFQTRVTAVMQLTYQTESTFSAVLAGYNPWALVLLAAIPLGSLLSLLLCLDQFSRAKLAERISK